MRESANSPAEVSRNIQDIAASFEVRTGVLTIEPGQRFAVGDQLVAIVSTEGLDRHRVRNLATGAEIVVSTGQLAPVPRQEPPPPRLSPESYSEEEWALAVQRFNCLKPLLGIPTSGPTIAAAATKLNVIPATIYKWLKKGSSGTRRNLA